MRPDVRLMRASDRRFVVPTWVKSFAELGPWPRQAALTHHWAAVDAILDDPMTRVVILSSGDDGGAVHGWAAADTLTGTLHYAYVPPELRGHGFARSAIAVALNDYADRIKVTHPWPFESQRFRWNPYPMMRVLAGPRREVAA